MANNKRVYWDSCMWIGLIMEEAEKIEVCQYVVDESKKGNLEIWTSSLTLAEVFKRKCGTTYKGIDASDDANFENFIEQDFLVEVQVDHEIGVTARHLLRAHDVLKKPMDAVHLATAVVNNVDEFHTFDNDDLLRLNGKVFRVDGVPLLILKPVLPEGYQASLLGTTTPGADGDE